MADDHHAGLRAPQWTLYQNANHQHMRIILELRIACSRRPVAQSLYLVYWVGLQLAVVLLSDPIEQFELSLEKVDVLFLVLKQSLKE